MGNVDDVVGFSTSLDDGRAIKLVAERRMPQPADDTSRHRSVICQSERIPTPLRRCDACGATLGSTDQPSEDRVVPLR